MVTKLKIAAFGLFMAYGIWLAFNQPPSASNYSSWNCAGSKALFCIQKVR
jgi:hypothetical protein